MFAVGGLHTSSQEHTPSSSSLPPPAHHPHPSPHHHHHHHLGCPHPFYSQWAAVGRWQHLERFCLNCDGDRGFAIRGGMWLKQLASATHPLVICPSAVIFSLAQFFVQHSFFHSAKFFWFSLLCSLLLFHHIINCLKIYSCVFQPNKKHKKNTRLKFFFTTYRYLNR